MIGRRETWPLPPFYIVHSGKKECSRKGKWSQRNQFDASVMSLVRNGMVMIEEIE